MITKLPRRLFLSGAVATFLAGCANKFSSYTGPDVTRLRLYKSQRLLVLDGAQGVLRSYPVGLGFAPEGHKQFEGGGGAGGTDARPKEPIPSTAEIPRACFISQLAFRTRMRPTALLRQLRASLQGVISLSTVARGGGSIQRISRTGPPDVLRSVIGRLKRFMQWCAMARPSTFMPDDVRPTPDTTKVRQRHIRQKHRPS